MRKVFVFAFIAVVLTLGAGSAVAAGRTQMYGPFASTSPDSGTCGNNWANDTFNRTFKVDTRPNADGNYSVVESFKKGTFVTIAGASPGACDTNPGGTVGDGVTGKMHGSFIIIVKNGTYNPNAVCDATTCGTTADFVKTVFGAGATYDIPTFLVHYNAKNHGDWKNASADRGGNHGDITGNP